MAEDRIEILVEQAHCLFGETSIFEFFDLSDRKEVLRTLVDFYGLVEVGKADRYLHILDQLKDHLNDNNGNDWSIRC